MIESVTTHVRVNCDRCHKAWIEAVGADRDAALATLPGLGWGYTPQDGDDLCPRCVRMVKKQPR